MPDFKAAALLQTCRIVHDEAFPIFYRSNVFYFEMGAGQPFPGMFRRDALALMTNISLGFSLDWSPDFREHNPESQYDKDFDLAVAAHVHALIKQCPCLRMITFYYLSRGFSRNGILKLLKAKFGCDHSDDLIEQMLDNINLGEDQGGRVLPYDTQRQGQEWDLDAVDVVIAGLKGQLASGLANELMSIQTPDETTVLLDEPVEILQNLENLRTRSQPGRHCAAGRPYESPGGPSRQPRGQEKGRGHGSLHVQPYNRNVVPESSAPRTAFGTIREQYQVTHHSSPPDVPAISTEYPVNPAPATPVALAPMNPTIPAPSPFNPGQPGGPLITTLNPAFLGTNFGGPQGTFYDQTPRFGGRGTSGSGSGVGGSSSGGREGQGRTDGK
ncbi:MAG: hypothetical protein ASARMPRED_001228 [Alectoria sarmentosa]|nr:MAG: hypothetical protein ASARMPRED_001228 [Alectoria sarmentosa]